MQKPYEDHMRWMAQEAGKVAGKEAVHETFRLLGIPTENENDIRDFRRNMDFLDGFRKVARNLNIRVWVALCLGAIAFKWDWQTLRDFF